MTEISEQFQISGQLQFQEFQNCWDPCYHYHYHDDTFVLLTSVWDAAMAQSMETKLGSSTTTVRNFDGNCDRTSFFSRLRRDTNT